MSGDIIKNGLTDQLRADIKEVAAYTRFCTRLISIFLSDLQRLKQSGVAGFVPDLKFDDRVAVLAGTKANERGIECKNTLTLIHPALRNMVANIVYDNFRVCFREEARCYVKDIRKKGRGIAINLRKVAQEAIFDEQIFEPLRNAISFLCDIHQVISDWVIEGYECLSIGGLSALLQVLGYRVANPYVVLQRDWENETIEDAQKLIDAGNIDCLRLLNSIKTGCNREAQLQDFFLLRQLIDEYEFKRLDSENIDATNLTPRYRTTPRTYRIATIWGLIDKLGLRKTVDKTKLAVFIEAVTGGNIEIKGKDTVSYKEPTEDAKKAAAELLKKIGIE